jgi:hypothetical protein
VAAAIAQRFATVFSDDVLHFEIVDSKPSQQAGDEVPKVDIPTLYITYKIGLSVPLTSRKPPGSYVGLTVTFKSQLLMPSQPATAQFKLPTWSPPDFRRLRETGCSPAELYTSMADQAFDQFVKKYLASVLAEPK